MYTYIYICMYLHIAVIHLYMYIHKCIYIYMHCKWLDCSDRRKFRSQTSDNMDRCQSKGEKSQSQEKEPEEKQSVETSSRCAKRKVAQHCVFPVF